VRVYSLSETCSIYNPCTPRELYQKDDPKTRKHPPEFKPIDALGCNGCDWCQRPYRENMMQCPECGKFFFGPIKNNYPRKLKLAIECDYCE
jgi:biotin synthase-related radical SAM superfamily protein